MIVNGLLTNVGLAGLAGFEPTTRGLENRCSILMSYRPLSGAFPPSMIFGGLYYFPQCLVKAADFRLQTDAKPEQDAVAH